MTKDEYSFWLANVKSIGIKKIELLLQVFGSAEGVFHASEKELRIFRAECCPMDLRFKEEDIKNLCESKVSEKIEDSYAKIVKSGIYFVSKENEHYPDKLRNIYGAPYALYIKGKLPRKADKVLAIVGARDCSQYGKEMAKYFSGAIAREGVVIISGLARGIDSFAHAGALSTGGVTCGVLGSGIDICYPKENINLFMNMQENGGIISEYAPGTKPFAGNFPMRNRIISGLCDAIFVIEAKEKSGSLITVDMGLEQGKDIYALPGKVGDQLSCGCNNLIKMGAKLVTTPKDILEDFFPDFKETVSNCKKNNKLLELNEKIVYASLCLDPKHIEEIAVLTGLSMDLLMEQLLILELRGLVKQTMKNYYIAQD